MKYLLSIIFLVFICASVTAQVKDEKTVSVNVNTNDKGERDIKITANQNGEKTVYEWKDNGTIPADIRKQLDAANIDVEILSEAKENNKEIIINVDRKVVPVRDQILIKKMDNDDEVTELKWDGEGEMPAEMQELLDEHDIDISTIAHGEQHAKSKSKEVREIKKKMRVKAIKRGDAYNRDIEKKYNVITIDNDGGKEVVEWTTDDTPLEDHEVITINVDDEGESETLMTIKRSVSKKNRLSDAYMGVHIESDDQGAKIIEIPKAGPASSSSLKEGDIIQRVNGAKIRDMNDLLDLLHFFQPMDKITVEVLRDGASQTVALQLGKRPEQYRL